MSGRAASASKIARRISRQLELTFPSPKLVEPIIADTQPADKTGETLTRRERGLVWPVDWVPNAD